MFLSTVGTERLDSDGARMKGVLGPNPAYYPPANIDASFAQRINSHLENLGGRNIEEKTKTGDVHHFRANPQALGVVPLFPQRNVPKAAERISLEVVQKAQY